MKFDEDIKTIEKYQKEIIILNRILGLLNWDNQTYMPKMASDERAEQTAYIYGLIHEKMIDDKFWKIVGRLYEKRNELNNREKRMIDILYKQISKSKKLSREFVEELAKEKSLSFNAWQKAREENDTNIFLPHFKKIVELKRKEVEYRGFMEHKYNTFLDDYEEGMTVKKLDPIFEELKYGLIKIINKIKKSNNYKNQKKNINDKNFSKEKQIYFAEEIIKKLGLDKDFSRLDLSEHPFSTSLGSKDVRITTNIRDDYFFSIGSTIHETGHALYELGMPKEEKYTFLGDAPSLGLHESQSRFWENMIGLSNPFWNYFFPRIKEIYGLKEDIDLWYKDINQVSSNLIRIESDEVHYCLHIIMRYEFEKGLIEGSINPDEISDLWKKKVKEYFDLEVKNDKEGFMQDVHWSEGYYGYFPTYAIGTIYASQIYKKLSEDMNIGREVSSGNFNVILNWLRENIHKYGSLKMADEIIKDACGKGLSVEDFLDYLNKKYKDIYDLM
ncbi:MAG: carboxypeptidase M32 [Nanoarchaeota archaeon]